MSQDMTQDSFMKLLLSRGRVTISDFIICEDCKRTTPHVVELDPISLEMQFGCKLCGLVSTELDVVTIEKEKDNAD